MLRSHFGRSAEAIASGRRATELDPLSSLAFWSLGNIQLRAGKLDGAEAALARTVELSPEQDRAHRDLGYLALVRGRPQEALAHFSAPGTACGRPSPGGKSPTSPSSG